MGFDARWGVVSAADVGAPHQRDRIWIVAHATQLQRNGGNDNAGVRLGRESVSQFGNGSGPQVVGNANSKRLEKSHNNAKFSQRIQQKSSQRCDEVSNSSSLGFSGQRQYEQSVNSAQSRKRQAIELVYGRSPDFWAVEPTVGRVADGVAARVDRLKAIGNGQVPAVAATAWNLLK
jgi:DNA (cytosine-5)-methyltransferase 1